MHARTWRFLLPVAMLALVACTHSDLRPDYVRQPSTMIVPKADAPLVTEATRMTSSHAGQSGVRLLGDSIDALLARIALADRAKYSIDLQYYIYFGDATGKLLAQHLLQAADRGVRVRVLLDDLHEMGKEDVLHALDGHPNLEIRLFNPFHERSGSTWGMGKQLVGDFSRLNRRMHNKAFIVDGAAAVIGGRNIGDEYFDATEGVNFRDMDAIVVGPVVREVAQIFDLYWNSEPSVPVEAFVPSARPTTDIEQVRTKLTESARTIRESSYGESVLTEAGELRGNKSIAHWAWGDAMFLADDPGKVTPDVDSHELHLAPRVREWLDTAHSRILLISPYFIPGDKGVAYIEQKRAQGIEVSVLTNSLASTDADAVYAAYASYLPKLLAAGVKVYELKPDAARSKKQQHLIASTAGQSSLHAKVMVVDDDKSFVGSMNLDPRSQSLNTEDGLLLTSPVLASELSAIFDRATDPEFTYEVLLEKGSKDRVYWQTQENGVTVRYDDAPRTSSWRRFKAGSTRLLPAEDML